MFVDKGPWWPFMCKSQFSALFSRCVCGVKFGAPAAFASFVPGSFLPDAGVGRMK